MKNNFSLKFKLFDIFILAFVTVAIVFSIIGTNMVFSNELKDNYVIEIYYQEELLEDKSVMVKDIQGDSLTIVLSKNEYDKLLGDVTIIIDKNKGICISDVTCPNETCLKMGWVRHVGYPVTCLPNGVFVLISAPDVDQDTILG